MASSLFILEAPLIKEKLEYIMDPTETLAFFNFVQTGLKPMGMMSMSTAAFKSNYFMNITNFFELQAIASHIFPFLFFFPLTPHFLPTISP